MNSASTLMFDSPALSYYRMEFNPEARISSFLDDFTIEPYRNRNMFNFESNEEIDLHHTKS
jgi:hypothetical protein